MASPFSTFRKNQRLWMAAAVLVAILAFVIAPMLESFTGIGRKGGRRNGRSVDATFASWRGGSITRSQLDREVYQLQLANRFLRKLAVDVREAKGQPNVPEFSPDLQVVGISTIENADSILERKLLVAEGQRLGIHFDEQSVKLFLQKFVDGKLSGAQIEKTLNEVCNRGMNMYDLVNLLKEELTKNEVLRLADASMRYQDRRPFSQISRPISTPSKNWQDFLKFNRAAKIRAYPVFVDEYLTNVTGKPTDKQLRDLYEEGKERTRNQTPVKSQPAFMNPRLGDFEFLAIDFDAVIEQEKGKISEETLRAEYERRVKENQFRVKLEPPKSLPETNPTALPPSDTPPAESTPATPDAAAPTSSEPAPTSEPTSTPPVTEPPKEGTEPAPIPDVPATVPNPETKPDPKSQSGIATQLEARLVSMRQDPVVPPTTEPTPTAQEGTTPPVQASTPAEQEGSATVPADTVTAPPSDVAESTPMRTQTFEEVRDQIAKELSLSPATKSIDERMNSVYALMNTYVVEYRAYAQSVTEKDTKAKAPQRPDLAKIADEIKFQYGTTGLVDEIQVRNTPIGSSLVLRGQRANPVAFASIINSAEMGNTFEPMISYGFTGGNVRYLFWRTETKDPYTPSFDQVRDQVMDVWRNQQAILLAEAKAKEIASQSAGKSLKEIFSSEDETKKIMEPTSFTWFNPLFARMESRMQLSVVDLLRPVDDSFMEIVFKTEPGESAVAMDAAKTICYVIQVESLSPDTATLFDKFAAAPTLNGVMAVSESESIRSLRSWFSNLQKELDFKVN